jgi:flagellar biosynthesis/type III secretory pathway protein FliH
MLTLQPQIKKKAENFIHIAVDELASAKEEAFNLGKQEGLAEASRVEAEQLATQTALENIRQAIANLENSKNNWQHNLLQACAKLAFVVAQKLVYSSLNANSEIVITNFIKEVLPTIVEEKKIIVKLSSKLTDLPEKLIPIFDNTSLKGKVSYQFDDEISIYDCSIILSGGKLLLSNDDLQAKIEEVFKNYFG